MTSSMIDPPRDADPGTPARHRCPRCGYDVRAEIVRWREACPLDGRCAECGLAFRWADVFCPSKRVPAWSVEYAASARWLDACVATILRSVRPLHFWRGISMAVPVRGGRLGLYVMTLAVAVYVGVVLALGAVYGSWMWSMTTGRYAGDDLGVCVRRAVFTPWSTESPGIFGMGRWVWPAPSPRDFISMWSEPLHRAAAVPVFGACLCPFALLLLRTTLRRARVRPGHVVRAGVYGLGGPVLLLVVMLVVGVWQPIQVTWLPTWWSPDPPAVLGISAGIVVAWMAAWWWAVARVYLAIEQPLAVTLAVLVLGVLGAVSAQYLIDPDSLVGVIVQWM